MCENIRCWSIPYGENLEREGYNMYKSYCTWICFIHVLSKNFRDVDVKNGHMVGWQVAFNPRSWLVLLILHWSCAFWSGQMTFASFAEGTLAWFEHHFPLNLHDWWKSTIHINISIHTKYYNQYPLCILCIMFAFTEKNTFALESTLWIDRSFTNCLFK